MRRIAIFLLAKCTPQRAHASSRGVVALFSPFDGAGFAKYHVGMSSPLGRASVILPRGDSVFPSGRTARVFSTIPHISRAISALSCRLLPGVARWGTLLPCWDSVSLPSFLPAVLWRRVRYHGRLRNELVSLARERRGGLRKPLIPGLR